MAMPPIKLPGGRKSVALALATTLAVPAEGLRQVAYYDPPGILTVCRGHTGADVSRTKRYSLAECDALFDTDMRAKIEVVDRCAPGLPVEVLAAFADAAYNIGPAIACDTGKSTAARMLKASTALTGTMRADVLTQACNQLPRWDKAKVAGVSVALPGLTKRRGEEKALCLEGVNNAG